MRQIIDETLKGVANIYDGAEEVVETAKNAVNACPCNWPWNNADWIGAHFNSWNDVRQKLRASNEAGMRQMESVQKHIANAVLSPTVRTRQHRWSEDAGEIQSDRVIAGEPSFYRDTFRARKLGSQNIAILTHIGGLSTRSVESMFWSAAAAISAVDIMEAAGYSCEVWAYNASTDAYTNGYGSFKAIRMKESGSPLDRQSLINTTSGWFYRSAGLAQLRHAPYTMKISCGCTVGSIGKWKQYLDLGDSQVISLVDCHTIESAINEAKRIISILESESE